MKLRKYTAWLLATTSLLCSASGCAFFGNKDDGGLKETSVRATSPKHEKIVVLANVTLADFTENYTMYAGELYYSAQSNYVMSGVTLTWTADTPTDEYAVAISTAEDLSNAITYETTETQLHVDDLFVDTQYYWQITAKYETEEKKSAIYSFKTAKTPRTIYMEGVKNTRDIGGKITEDGKKLRQGMAYRGARLDQISANGVVSALKTYGIKTDLDLRKAGEGTAGGESPLGADIQYFHYSCPYYWGGTNGIDYIDNHANLASAIKVFAKEENYPIYFHCSIGRDRTSMVAMLIQGVLGVPLEGILMDYELSFLTEKGFYDTATPTHMVDTFMNTYSHIASYNGAYTFMEGCEAYLLDIGVTSEEIEAIRFIMLES